MRRRFLLMSLSLLVAALPAFADDGDAKADGSGDLVGWVEENAGRGPEEIDGVKIFRPTETDGKQMVSDIFEVAGMDKMTIMAKALAYCTDVLDKETEIIETVEPASARFVIGKVLTAGEGRNAATFTCHIAFQAGDGILSFACYDLTASYKEKGILPRTLAFEKLKPAEKSQHKEMVEAFSIANSRFLKEVFDFVATGECQPVTHWAEIEACEVVKGMNETEVKLSIGRPAHVSNAGGGRVKWMINNSFVIIFTDGVVTSVIR